MSQAASSQSDADKARAWKLLDKFHLCMLATYDGAEIRVRPMGLYLRPEENALYFLTDARGHKDEDIALYPHVTVICQDRGANLYIAVAGRATISQDKAKIRDLWNPAAQAWWEGPDDSAIRVLRVTPNDAQFWDGPNALMSTAAMLGAAVTGQRPSDLGDNRKVDM